MKKKKKSKRIMTTSFSFVRGYFKEICGIEAVKIIEALEKKNKPLKDEEIAKHVNMKVTEARVVLNKLNYRGITDYDKKKDKNSGWYHYTWKINKKRIIELLTLEQKKILNKLKNRKKMQENYSMFSCKEGCLEEPFEVAIEYNFKCPKCGDELKYIENKKQIKKFELNIKKIQNSLNELRAIK